MKSFDMYKFLDKIILILSFILKEILLLIVGFFFNISSNFSIFGSGFSPNCAFNKGNSEFLLSLSSSDSSSRIELFILSSKSSSLSFSFSSFSIFISFIFYYKTNKIYNYIFNIISLNNKL